MLHVFAATMLCVHVFSARSTAQISLQDFGLGVVRARMLAPEGRWGGCCSRIGPQAYGIHAATLCLRRLCISLVFNRSGTGVGLVLVFRNNALHTQAHAPIAALAAGDWLWRPQTLRRSQRELAIVVPSGSRWFRSTGRLRPQDCGVPMGCGGGPQGLLHSHSLSRHHHTNIHTCTHTCQHTFIHASMHAYIHSYITHVHTNKQTFTYAYT